MADEIPVWAINTKADKRAIDEGCYWDNKLANRATNFINKHFKSQFNKQFKLVTEQFRLIQQLYGWRLPNGNRRYRFANLHVPKKSFGKTTLTSAICMYELLASGEPSPVIYSAGASKSNAGQIFDEIHYAIENSQFKSFARVRKHVKEIDIPDINARFKSVASDGKRLNGHNCSTCIFDECFIMPSILWHALRYSTSARPNGICICISTSGEDTSHWYYDVYRKSKRILSGEETDISHFALVYEMDDDGNPDDEEQWKKANPLLGNNWCPLDQFRRDYESAKTSGLGEYLNFLRLRLNKWVQVDQFAYFDVSKFDECCETPDEETLKACPAVIGADLSETLDPSSVSITWDLGDGRYHTRTKVWICEAGVKKREASLMRSYRDFPNIEITQGDMLDERLVLNYLIDLYNQYDIKCANFDPRSAYVLANRYSEQGVKCHRIPATARYFNPAMTELKKAIDNKRLTHENDTWLKFCLQNIRVEINNYEEVYPIRKKSIDKIDSGISLLLSIIGLISNKEKRSEIVWN